ncbi:hypothetical protein KY345_02220 [Candidatus Woesearchaeota archaeon]|nr:hypothetical protein [Candidatus Woesearchaeota archaeon]
MAGEEKPKTDYLNILAEKYAKDIPHNFEGFDKRWKAYKDFHDPKNKNIEAIADEVKDIIAHDETGIHIKHHKDIKELFDYDDSTHKAGRDKLGSDKEGEEGEEEDEKAKGKIKEFLQKYMEAVVERYAGTRLDQLKETYKGKKKELAKQIETLYCKLTGLDPTQERLTSDSNVDNLLRANYQEFTQTYDAMLNQAHSGFSQYAQQHITGHLVQENDKTNIAKAFEKEIKKHPDLDFIKTPHSEDFSAHQVAASFRVAFIRPETRAKLRPGDLEDKFNLRIKKKEKKEEETPPSE